MKITIIGGGPGGYVAALKAAILGAEVNLVEKTALGGTCLNRGCIPTKAYLSCSEIFEAVSGAGDFGIDTTGSSIDFERIYQRKNALVKQLTQGVGFLLGKRKVRVLRAEGRLLPDKSVEAAYDDGKKEVLESDRIILATGSAPMLPSIFKYDGQNIMSSDEILSMSERPKSLLIIGGGVVGCEFGQFLGKIGAEVSIVEMAESILPLEDEDISGVLSSKMKKEGIRLYTGRRLESVQLAEGGVSCVLSDGKSLAAEKMLISIGRRANIEGLGLEGPGVEVRDGFIHVNDRMETSVPDIYAIGDIVNTPQLAHVASREAIVAVENIMGRTSTADYRAVPRCVYTDPEIASVGITEARAADEGKKIHVGRFNFSGIGKALIMGKPRGFVKIITDDSDVIIGASIAGPHAADLLGELTLSVHLGLKARELGSVIHPHPGLSEAVMEAVHDVHREAVHSF